LVGGTLGFKKMDRTAGATTDDSGGQTAENSKFNNVMHWGTPRLVTNNRALVMDQDQLKQRAFLQNIAAIRKGNGEAMIEEKKSNFKAVTVNNFREKMLQEEKLEQQQDANLTLTTMATSNNPSDNPTILAPPDLGLEKPSPASTYPAKINNLMKPLGTEIKDTALNNQNQRLLQMTMTGQSSNATAAGAGNAGLSVFNKLRNIDDEEVKKKLMAVT
jgi:hypothetical protein